MTIQSEFEDNIIFTDDIDMISHEDNPEKYFMNIEMKENINKVLDNLNPIVHRYISDTIKERYAIDCKKRHCKFDDNNVEQSFRVIRYSFADYIKPYWEAV